jgi:site-specific recombinase XerD
MDVRQVCNDFLAYCRQEKHLSPNTLAAYRQDLTEYQRFGDIAQIDDITGVHVVAYVGHLTNVRRLAPASIKRRLACLRAACGWLVRKRGLTVNPFTEVQIQIRIPARLPRCLSNQDIAALLSATEGTNTTTCLSLHLLLATGIRVGELVHIRVSDVDTQQQTVRIFGKGNRERQVFLPCKELAAAVQSYIFNSSRFSITRSSHSEPAWPTREHRINPETRSRSFPNRRIEPQGHASHATAYSCNEPA